MFHTFVRRRALGFGALAFALVVPSLAKAQNTFEDIIRQQSKADAKGYTQPLADVLIANLSSGYFSSAGPSGKPSFTLEFIGMGTMISDKMKTYTANTPPGFTPSTFQAPTVFGGKATPVAHSTIPELTYRTSDGVLSADLFPTAVPQIRVGGFLNSEVVVRYFNSNLLSSLYPKDELPQLNMFGIGARHSLSRYFTLPVDIGLEASYNTLTFGDYVDVKGLAYGATVGKTYGVLSVMGGVESSGGTMNLSYTSENTQSPGTVDLDLKSPRSVSFNLGATLNFPVIKLNGSISLGNITTYSGGLGIGF